MKRLISTTYTRISPLMTIKGSFLLLLLLASCNKADIDRPEPQQGATPISFNGTSVAITRGADYLLDTKGQTISIFGYHTADRWKGDSETAIPNLFHRQRATKDNDLGVNIPDTYSYSPAQYWYTSGYHHFFAFAPYGVAIDGEDGHNHISLPTDPGQPWITYMVPTNAADHKDVLWAYAQKNGNPLINIPGTPNGNYADLNFDFHHALTKIAFQAKLGSGVPVGADGAVNKYMITAITIQNVLFEATTKFKYGKNAQNVDAYTGATWVLDADQHDQQDIFLATNKTDLGVGLGYKYNNYTLLATTLTPTATQITNNPLSPTPANPGGYLYMMPQQVEWNTESSDDPTIYIAVTDDNKTPTDYTDDITRILTMPMTSPDIYIGDPKNPNKQSGQDGKGDGWWSGQSILYTITYHGGGDLPLGITATVTPWNKEDVPVKFGTYLNVTANTITLSAAGGSAVQNYWTDWSGTVTATASGSGISVSAITPTSLPTGYSGRYTITATAGASGKVTITAGNLSKEITITAN